MGKLNTVLTVAITTLLALVTGCNTGDPELLVTKANAAGNLSTSAWLTIANPDTSVKTGLEEVISVIELASADIGAGGSYVDTLSPVVQKAIAGQDGLTVTQKNLINVGAMVVLGGLDAFMAENPDVHDKTELAAKVVSGFCKGCLVALRRTDNCKASKAIIKAHQATKMRYSKNANAFTVK